MNMSRTTGAHNDLSAKARYARAQKAQKIKKHAPLILQQRKSAKPDIDNYLLAVYWRPPELSPGIHPSQVKTIAQLEDRPTGGVAWQSPGF